MSVPKSKSAWEKGTTSDSPESENERKQVRSSASSVREPGHWPKYFIRSAGWILLVTGFAKLISSTGRAGILTLSDPLFGIPFRYVMLSAGIIEICVGVACFLEKLQDFQATSVAWLATNFILYRFGLGLVGWHGVCPCLGTLTQALHMRSAWADSAAKVLMGYLALGGYAALIGRSPRVRASRSAFIRARASNLLLIFSALAALPFSSRGGDQGPSYTCKGTLHYQVYGKDTNSIAFESNVAFESDVDGCRWAITAKTVPDDGHPEEMICDGVYTRAVTLGVSTASSPPLAPRISALVKEDPSPFSLGKRQECVWVALASSCYLDAAKPDTLSSGWFDVNRTEPALLGESFHAKIERLAGPPRLPKSIECRANGLIYNRSGTQKTRLHSPFQDGYLRFTYRALATTNCAGAMEIPSAAVFRFLQPAAQATEAPNVQPVMQVELSVSEVTSPCLRNAWEPPLSARARVQDFRFITPRRNEGMILYDIPGPHWPAESEGVVTRARFAALNKAAASGAGIHVSRRYVIGVMLLVTLVTLALITYRLRQPAR